MTDRSSVHHAAATGFGAAAEAYRHARPDYPAALADWLRGELGLAPGRVVVDLGAGTGKFTPLLSATGARLVAVEPVEAMRAELAAAHPTSRRSPAKPSVCRSPTPRSTRSSAPSRSTGSPRSPRSPRCGAR